MFFRCKLYAGIHTIIYLTDQDWVICYLHVFTYLPIILIFYELTNKNNVEILELKSTSFLIFQKLSALIEQLSNKYFFLHTCLCVVLSHLLVLYVFVCVLKYVNVFIDVPHHVVFWSLNEKYFDSNGFEKQPKIYKIENRPEHFLEHYIIIKSHFYFNYMYMYKTKIVTKDY